MVEQAIGHDPSIGEQLKRLHPIGRIGEVSEIAEAASGCAARPPPSCSGSPSPSTAATSSHEVSAPLRTAEAASTVRRLATQGHLIGPSWRAGGGGSSYEHRYAATGEVQALVGRAGPDDVDTAVHCARTASPQWASWTPRKRAAVLFRLADLLESHAPEAAELAALDNGPGHTRPPGCATTPDGATSSMVRSCRPSTDCLSYVWSRMASLPSFPPGTAR